MVVNPGRSITFDDKYAARHTEMNNCRSTAGVKQQVLGTSSDGFNDRARQLAIDFAIDGPSQSPFADHYIVDALTVNVWRNTATAGFDFGELGHCWSLLQKQKGPREAGLFEFIMKRLT